MPNLNTSIVLINDQDIVVVNHDDMYHGPSYEYFEAEPVMYTEEELQPLTKEGNLFLEMIKKATNK